MKVISILNPKGGAGKTVSSVNIAYALIRKGKKVLLIDLDPQSNSTTGLGIDRSKIKKSIYNVIVGDCEIKEAIYKTPFKNLSIVPSVIDLAGAEMELFQIGFQDKEFIITEQLKQQLNK